ncbi:MAG: hypothetical protein ISP69_01100 [Crocinitomicaceae bacterium]|nr:hypothetical protein [Crocinitomicaceae bacterium]
MGFRLIIISFSMVFLSSSFFVKAQDAIIDFPVTIIGNGVGKRALSQEKLKSYFSGEFNNWPNKKRVIIVLPSSKHPHVELYSHLLYGKSFYFVKKYWYSLVFQGRFEAPFFFDSDEEIISFVQNNVGALSIISLDREFDSDKIITIEK